MYKIAVVGDQASVLVYKAFGMDTLPAESAHEAAKILKRLEEDEYAVVFLTEQLAAEMTEELEKYASRVTPAIIMIPGSQGSLGIGMAAISAAVEKAVGADIFAGSEDSAANKAAQDAGRMDN